MIWNEEYETMPREQLEALQFGRLKDLVERVYYRVKPYRAKMDEIGLKPEHIKSLADLPKLKEIDELLKDDEKFLESLDQVSLQQLAPEALGIKVPQELNQDQTELDISDSAQKPISGQKKSPNDKAE